MDVGDREAEYKPNPRSEYGKLRLKSRVARSCSLLSPARIAASSSSIFNYLITKEA